MTCTTGKYIPVHTWVSSPLSHGKFSTWKANHPLTKHNNTQLPLMNDDVFVERVRNKFTEKKKSRQQTLSFMSTYFHQ